MESPDNRMVRAISLGVSLTGGAFDEGDHPVDEGLPRVRGDADDDPVGEHPGAAGDGRPIAARFSDDGGRLAGECRFIHRGDSLDHLAIGRNDLSCLDDDRVTDPQSVANTNSISRWSFGSPHPLGAGLLPGRPHCIGLGLAPPFGHGLGEIGEENGEPEPDRYLEGEGEVPLRATMS